ncbi:hypothetical protein GQU05_004490 [Salmonella enterica]|nr:hypothetical protein [Salmonella enterica]
MTQLKIRLRRLRFSPCTIRNIPPKKRSRVDAAINGKYTLKFLPPDIREMLVERACLKLELKILSACSSNSKHNLISIQIAEKLIRIEKIDHLLKGR